MMEVKENEDKRMDTKATVDKESKVTFYDERKRICSQILSAFFLHRTRKKRDMEKCPNNSHGRHGSDRQNLRSATVGRE